ncbi:tetratricopeptide repeat protein [Nitrincola nitratireducens]|uniref:Sel1 repeat protein n=1 Tax=Nitrincola nitratireducens TaxID=1229521 RepID=W9UYC0_9GAMM|nr:tetratricopeptide repeat protein [Nitrincola nitratireducens]EXJ12233.1 Sel1 repeat protein [Nitrincola nitratireducens]
MTQPPFFPSRLTSTFRMMASICILMVLVGCETAQRQTLLKQTGGLIKRSGEAIQDLSQTPTQSKNSEINQLFAQPYIDPLTQYLERNRHRKELRSELNSVRAERDRRCAAIAERFNNQALTQANLNRYRAGYLYSCPNDVNAYAQRLAASVAQSATQKASVQTIDATQSNTLSSPSRTDSPPSNADALKECYLLVSIRNYHEALKICQPLAEQNDVAAQTQMARVHYALKNYDQTLHWANRAAPRSAEAAYLLGQLHQKGHGTPTDLRQASLWYQRASSMGHTEAQQALNALDVKPE